MFDGAWKRRVAAACLAGLLLAAGALADEAPQEKRTGLPVNRAVISPSGKHVAAVIRQTWGNEVVLIDTDDFSYRTLLGANWVREGFYQVKRDPWRVNWVNSSWLAVDYAQFAEVVDLAGNHVADLGTGLIGHIGWQTPDEPTMLVYDDDKHESLSVINVRTRDRRGIRVPMSGDVVGWAFDGRGELRSAVMASSEFWDDRTTLSYWYRRLGSDAWTQLEEAPLTQGDHWWPLAASSTSDELTVVSREGRDTWAVFSYDPIARSLGRMLAGSPVEDVYAVSDLRTDQVRGVISHGMKPTSLWFDARMTELQGEVDKALPGRVNEVTGNPEGKVLILSYSDVDPGRWYVLDTRDWTMRLLLEARAGADPAAMRSMQIMSYQAADGLAIPAYLTRPAGDEGPRPMVVMVHGGPATRDHWGWDREVQMLAAHG